MALAATAIAPALANPPAVAQPAFPTCWQDISTRWSDADTGLATASLSVDGAGDGTLWVSSMDPRHPLSYWDGETWQRVAKPTVGSDSLGGRYGTIRALPGGEAVAAWTANTSGCFSEVFVQRYSGGHWTPLGSSLRNGTAGCTHANEAALLPSPDGGVVVAWEEAESNNPRSLFASAWSEGKWRPLGVQVQSEVDVYSLDPDLVRSPAQEPWLAWEGGSRNQGYLRVSRWTGTAWMPLEASLPPAESPAHARIGFGLGGRPVLAWEDGWPKGPARLRLVSWNGAKWDAVDLPVAKERWVTSGPALLAASHGSLVVAFSARKGELRREFSKAYVAAWDGSAWTILLDGIRLGPVPSDVVDVQLARGAGADVFVVWDEPADDNKRIRVVRLYPCQPGEKPAPLPPTAPRESLWPKTVDDAARALMNQLDRKDLDAIRRMKKEELIDLHFGLGMYIRNRYGLWQDNKALLKSCAPERSIHPDDCSGIIIERLWEGLQPASDAGR